VTKEGEGPKGGGDTRAGGHVRRPASVEEPITGAGWLCGDASVVEHGVEGPRVLARRTIG
jgi:hypothetical protein